MHLRLVNVIHEYMYSDMFSGPIILSRDSYQNSHELEVVLLEDALFSPLFVPLQKLLADAAPVQLWAVMVLAAAEAGDIVACKAADSAMQREIIYALRDSRAKAMEKKREDGRKRTGKVGDLRDAIEFILHDIPEPDFEQLLEKLRNCDLMDELYNDEKIDILVLAVNQEAGEVKYRPRGFKGRDKKFVKFKTLKNTLAEIRKQRVQQIP